MSVTWSWILLIAAGGLEICWAMGLKYSDGFTKIGPTVFTVITFTLSILLLGKAAQTLPIGTAYGVWVGIGALGAGVLGIFLFQEPATPLRLAFFALLLVAIMGLKLTS